MTAIAFNTKSPATTENALPATLTRLERLLIWGLTLFQHLYPTSRISLDPAADPVNRITQNIFTANDGKEYYAATVYIQIDPAWRQNNSAKFWTRAIPVSDAVGNADFNS